MVLPAARCGGSVNVPSVCGRYISLVGTPRDWTADRRPDRTWVTRAQRKSSGRTIIRTFISKASPPPPVTRRAAACEPNITGSQSPNRPLKSRASQMARSSLPFQSAGKLLKIYDANGFFAETPVSTGMRGHSELHWAFSASSRSRNGIARISTAARRCPTCNASPGPASRCTRACFQVILRRMDVSECPWTSR